VRELNLGLGPPHPAQIWRLVEPPADTPIMAADHQVAAQAGARARAE
jgi:hypothetical protein